LKIITQINCYFSRRALFQGTCTKNIYIQSVVVSLTRNLNNITEAKHLKTEHLLHLKHSEMRKSCSGNLRKCSADNTVKEILCTKCEIRSTLSLLDCWHTPNSYLIKCESQSKYGYCGSSDYVSVEALALMCGMSHKGQ